MAIGRRIFVFYACAAMALGLSAPLVGGQTTGCLVVSLDQFGESLIVQLTTVRAFGLSLSSETPADGFTVGVLVVPSLCDGIPEGVEALMGALMSPSDPYQHVPDDPTLDLLP